HFRAHAPFPAVEHGFLQRRPPLLDGHLWVEALYRPGVDVVQESVEGEAERVDPLPGERPVDLRPPAARDEEEVADGGVGRSLNSAKIWSIRPPLGFCSLPPIRSSLSSRRAQIRRSTCCRPSSPIMPSNIS